MKEEFYMKFDYVYKDTDLSKADSVPMPKILNEGKYQGLKCGSKILYTLMLERDGIANLNGLCDTNGKTIIFYPITEIMNNLHVSKNTAAKFLKQLEEYDLIKMIRRRGGRPSVIYVNKPHGYVFNFMKYAR